MMLRFDRFLNFIYTWFVQRVEKREEFDTLLLEPIPGQGSRVKAPTRADLEAEGAEFMAFMGSARTH